MQKKVLFLGFVIMMISTLPLNAQYAKTDSAYKKWFVGSTLFLLGNLDNVNPPGFAQLNVGYRITGKDVISLELITWKHAWPLGINPFYNKAYGTPEEKYPGYIREHGFGFAYQRYFWKGLYAAVIFGKVFTQRYTWRLCGKPIKMKTGIRWEMVSFYSIRIALAIMLNYLRIVFL